MGKYVNPLERTPPVMPKPSASDLDTVEMERVLGERTAELPLEAAGDDPTLETTSTPPYVAPVKPVQPELPSPAPAKTIEPLMSGFRTLPDGSLRGVITISVENSELLRTWAEGAGTDLTEYINEHVNEALMAYAASTSEA